MSEKIEVGAIYVNRSNGELYSVVSEGPSVFSEGLQVVTVRNELTQTHTRWDVERFRIAFKKHC